MDADSTATLALVPFLSDLSADELRELSRESRKRRFRRNEVIFHRDDPGESLFIVLAGRVRISLRSEDGRERTLTTLGPGECFGELALLDGAPRSADAVAEEATETLTLPRTRFLAFLHERPEASLALLVWITGQFRRLTDSFHDAAFLDVQARLARVICSETEQPGETGELVLRMTQVDLASRVGATRESVNNWLGYFERRGWVHRGRSVITVTDRASIEKLLHQAL